MCTYRFTSRKLRNYITSNVLTGYYVQNHGSFLLTDQDLHTSSLFSVFLVEPFFRHPVEIIVNHGAVNTSRHYGSGFKAPNMSGSRKCGNAKVVATARRLRVFQVSACCSMSGRGGCARSRLPSGSSANGRENPPRSGHRAVWVRATPCVRRHSPPSSLRLAITLRTPHCHQVLI